MMTAWIAYLEERLAEADAKRHEFKANALMLNYWQGARHTLIRCIRDAKTRQAAEARI